jgi:hypothetical protein
MSTERSAADTVSAGIGDKDAETILRALRDHPGGMSRHQIRRTLFGANKPAGSIAAMLEMLQSRGLVASESIQTRGRPATRWYAISASNAESRPALAISPPDAAPVEPEPEPDVEPASLAPHGADDRDDRRRCATDHLAALGHQGGHGPAWDAARTLIGRFGLTPKEAFPLLADWNQTCRSPLNTHDLAWKLDYVARESAARPRGSRPGPSSGMAEIG